MCNSWLRTTSALLLEYKSRNAKEKDWAIFHFNQNNKRPNIIFYDLFQTYSRSLSNATSSNAILESTLIPFSLKNIWSTLFFLHFLWGTLIFSPLNQRCSRKNQRCSNFPDQKIFPWAMLIFPWTTLIWST